MADTSFKYDAAPHGLPREFCFFLLLQNVAKYLETF